MKFPDKSCGAIWILSREIPFPFLLDYPLQTYRRLEQHSRFPALSDIHTKYIGEVLLQSVWMEDSNALRYIAECHYPDTQFIRDLNNEFVDHLSLEVYDDELLIPIDIGDISSLKYLKSLSIVSRKQRNLNLQRLENTTLLSKISIDNDYFKISTSLPELSNIEVLSASVSDIDLSDNNKLESFQKLRQLSLYSLSQSDNSHSLRQLLKRSTQINDISLYNFRLTREFSEVLAQTSLVNLVLSEVKIQTSNISHLELPQNLSSLTIEYSDLAGPIQYHENLELLTCLNLRGSSFNENNFLNLENLIELHELSLRDTSIYDSLSKVSSLAKLEYLDLEGTLSDDKLVHLLTLLPNLKLLNMCDSKISDMCGDYISKVSALREINIAKCHLSDAFFIRLVSNEAVESINANFTSITDVGISYLSQLSGIKVLELSNTQLTDKGMVFLGSVGTLEYVNISNTLITDQGIIIMKHFGNLKCLILNNTAITDVSVSTLVNFTKLKFLSIVDTALSQQSIDTIKRLLPQCDIAY